MFQEFHMLIGEIDPKFNPVERLCVFGGDEAEAIDMLAVVEVFSQEIEHQVRINLVFVLLISVDWKHKSTSILVFWVLPFRLNPFLEILH